VAKFITVTGLGIIELWAAIPAGTALKLHPLLNGLASGLGAIIGGIGVSGMSSNQDAQVARAGLAAL